MNHKHPPLDRLCRLNGQQPTLRDRWIAFHRLYRIAAKHPQWLINDACDALRIFSPRWTSLLNAQEDMLGSRRGLPLFLRKRLLEHDRQIRLRSSTYGERDKQVANAVRNQHGMEVTPDEVAEVRYKIVKAVQRKSAEANRPVPTEEEVMQLLKAYHKHEEQS